MFLLKVKYTLDQTLNGLGSDVSKISTCAAVRLFPILPSPFRLVDVKVRDRKAPINFLPIFS